MGEHAETYGAEFFDTIRAGCQASAAVVAPIVQQIVAPSTVIDVGCGEGWWARAFADLGCEVAGVDGGPTAAAIGRYTQHDLDLPLDPALGRFDLAVSLEVAEHLTPERAPSFVADLCRLAPVVLFSAAVPGQGGTEHLNERWPGYWCELFRSCGFAVSGALRWRIWCDATVENWYRQNLLVATSAPERFPELFDTPLAEPWPVVHPVLFEAHRLY